MSSDDEKAAIQARLYNCIKRKEPGWQEESLAHFLLKASGPPAPEHEIAIQRMTRGAPGATPPVIYLPGPRSAVIGKDIEKGSAIAIGDEERCGGMYILGQPRTGKSNLLVSLALHDVKNGYGILFIDPHTDAITALHARIPDYRRKDIVFLDPTKKDTSFGINLLECADKTDPLSVEETWARVKDIFVKVWGDERGQLGIWLEKILRNCVYLLVDNPTYTLVDIPLILDEDTTFRNFLLGNVESNPYIEDFWFREFDRLTRRDKTEQVGPALSRLDVLRGNTIIRHIVGQGKTTVDFNEILNGNGDQKIVLLRMPVYLDEETKRIVGTMVLSQVVAAAFNRDKIPEDKRRYFGIYCDEFQEFATPDFARLFTQTGKYKVMPSVAHQTRTGQFPSGDPNRGATLTAPNKVLFSLSVHDATELALEFAKSPTETGVVSQYPVRDLLEGHHNRKIREFVNKYIRVLEDKRDNIRADMEGVKFARMVELDTAAIYGAEAQGEGVMGGSHYAAQLQDVYARRSALSMARMLSIKLVALHKESNRLRVTMRELDRFLVEIMEGEKRAEQEAFADFLINLVHSASIVDKRYAKVLDLYIAVTYGDPGKPRTIPFDLARSQGLFSKEVTALTFQAAKKTEEERLAFRARFIPEEEQDRARRRMRERESKPRDRLRAMEGKIVLMNRRCSDIGGGRTGTRGHNMIRQEDFIWYPANVYTWFMWLSCYPNIEKLLIPYRTAKFTETWEYLMSDGQAAKTIAKLDESLNLVKPWEYGSEKYMEFMRAGVARDLKDFLNRYQEGALVMLALADCAGKGGWGGGRSDDISLCEFPGIEGKDPVEVWCMVERLRVLMREALGEKKFSSLFIKYFVEHSGYSYDELDEKLYWAGFQTRVGRYPIYDGIKYRKDVQALEALLTERWEWFVRHHSAAGECWKKSIAPVRYYLLCRAADSLSFGEEYSSLPRAAFAPYEEVVGALVSLSKDTKARHDAAEEKEKAAKERQRIEKECAEKVREISYNPPAILESRVLTGSEIQEVKKACVTELSQDQNTLGVAATIDEFAEFCKLLAQPENRIKGRYGSTRTEADMVNEMARELVGLPKYAAYARVTQSVGGEQRVWKGKIRTDRI